MQIQLTKMGQWHDNSDVITYLFRIKLLQPEQAPRIVVDKVVATNKIIFKGDNLQDEFHTRWQGDIFVSSHIFQFTQNLIRRFRDDCTLLRIV